MRECAGRDRKIEGVPGNGSGDGERWRGAAVRSSLTIFFHGDTMESPRLGTILRHRRRRELDLPLNQVARKIGVGKGYLSGIELGRISPPSAKVLKKLARVLSLPSWDLQALAWAEKAPSDIRSDILDLVWRAIEGRLRVRPTSTAASEQVLTR